MSLILVIGGYGGFGARLCRRLSGAGHALLVGGRSGAKAAAFCEGFGNARPLVIDRGGDVGEALKRERPDLVIDAAGPFQDSGYEVPRACVAAGIPYLDLADGTGFVCGITALDHEASAAGVAIVSGASSVPALTGAVARHLAKGLERVHDVDIALSAANRATGGASVIAAILSYVGQPVRLRRGSRWTRGWGWQEMRREDFLLSDGTGLRGRLVALADVPDCRLLPEQLPGHPAVTFRAGTELGFHMRSLWLASWLVRWSLVPSLRGAQRWLLPLYRLTQSWGGERSAMSVTVAGSARAGFVERRWTVIAEQGQGLEVPTLTAQLLAEDLLEGRVDPGARTAAALLDFERYLPLLAALPLRHEVTERILPPPLYVRAMGAALEALPEAVRSLHNLCRDSGAAGEGIVVRGRGIAARLIGRAMGFPPAGTWPLHVAFAERGGVERWIRDFGGHVFSSELSAEPGGVAERFGPLRFTFDLPSGPAGLEMQLRRWTAFGVPMPRRLAPHIRAREWEEGGRFRFEVAVALPLLGEVVSYSGWLQPLGGSGRPALASRGVNPGDVGPVPPTRSEGRPAGARRLFALLRRGFASASLRSAA